MRLRVLVTSLLLVLLAAAAVRTAPRAAGDLLALTNATVVVGNGQTLPKATVVVRDGIIAAVGTKVAVPAGATVVDLGGAYLYPGLIDALTLQGLKRAPRPAPAAGAQPGSPTPAPPPPDHAGPDGGGFFAHVQAADQIETDAAAFAAWRDAGVLALHISPDRGIFEGQTAVVTFEGEAGAPKVVRRGAGMRIALRTLSAPRRLGSPVPGGLYPGALLSVWSHIKQTLLDTRHYAALPAADRGSIKYDEPARALEALRPVADGTMPLIIPANAEREVQRVIDLADQFSVRCIVAGGYEAARHAEALKAKKLPVVVSLNFPQPKVIALGQQAEFVQTAGAAAPEETYQEIRFRQHAPGAPAELARAGVRFALASDGLKSGREFLASLRLAVRKGLPREQAIRAAALSAAEILGVEQQLGSIEAGKIANLVVSDGDLFDERSRITAVYLAGRERTVGQKAAAAATPAPPAGQAGAATARPGAVAPPPPDIFFPPPVVAKELLIRNATVMTATHGTLKNTSILVRDGKIARVGENLKAGPQATVVDATGKWVTPGLIDTHNHFASDAHNDATIAVTSMTSIKDVINPTDIEIYRALAAGVTMVNTMHGSVNPIGGQNVLIKTRWGKDAKDLVVAGATPTLKFALGTNPKGRGTNPAPGVARRYPASRMGLEDVIRGALTEARDYKLQWEAYEKARAAGQAPLPPRRNLALEPLVEVLSGKRLALVHAYRADEMLMIMHMAEEFGFRIGRFEHGADAYKIAPEMAKHGAGVAAFDLLGTKVESWDAIPGAIPILVNAGVSVSIGTDGGAVAHMIHLAASALDEGLTEDQAIALVTINAAKQHGVDAFAGSIDEGKDADLVVFDKYPLSVYATPEQVYIDGQLYFSRERDRARQVALEADKKRLLSLDESPPPPRATSGQEPAGAGRKAGGK
jgi:imidazolonepropionase-like amidohydrolase